MLGLVLSIRASLAHAKPSVDAQSLSPQVDEITRATKCDLDFKSCTLGVDPEKAFSVHVSALSNLDELTARGNSACEASSDVPREGESFEASYQLPLVGDQRVTVDIMSNATALVEFSGVLKTACTVPFSTSETGLAASLSECSLPSSVSLKALRYCKDANELHALIGTSYTELNLVAKASVTKSTVSETSVAESSVAESSITIVTGTACKCSATPRRFKVQLDCAGPCDGLNVTGGSLLLQSLAKWCTRECHAPSTTKVSFMPRRRQIAAYRSRPRVYYRGCFAKQATTACRVIDATPHAAYDACYRGKGGSAAGAERVLMADLAASDHVLTVSNGELAITSVVANQHAASDEMAPMLTLHTSDGTTLSLTPDHAIYIDGELVAAANAEVGSTLTNARGEATTVRRIVRSESAVIINPVTATGTILAADKGAPVLAASHPMYIAPYVLASPVARAAVNAAVFVAGDVVDVATFAASVAAKITAAATLAALISKALRGRQSSN